MPDDRSPEGSVISDDYANRYPDLVGITPPSWRQEPDPFNFKRRSTVGDFVMEEAFAGSYDILKTLNPDVYAMPYGVSVPLLHVSAAAKLTEAL